MTTAMEMKLLGINNDGHLRFSINGAKMSSEARIFSLTIARVPFHDGVCLGLGRHMDYEFMLAKSPLPGHQTVTGPVFLNEVRHEGSNEVQAVFFNRKQDNAFHPGFSVMVNMCRVQRFLLADGSVFKVNDDGMMEVLPPVRPPFEHFIHTITHGPDESTAGQQHN